MASPCFFRDRGGCFTGDLYAVGRFVGFVAFIFLLGMIAARYPPVLKGGRGGLFILFISNDGIVGID